MVTSTPVTQRQVLDDFTTCGAACMLDDNLYTCDQDGSDGHDPHQATVTGYRLDGSAMDDVVVCWPRQ